MKKVLLVLLACFALVSSACGGSDDGESGSDSDFCKSARQFSEDFEESGNSEDPESEAELFKDLRDAIGELEDEAPEEIDDDVTVVADAFRESDDLLKKYDYDFTKVPEEEAEQISLNDPEVTEASNNVESYFEKECGIDSDGDGDTDGNVESTDPTAVDESGTDDGSGSDDTTDDTTDDTSGEEQAPDDTTETTAEGE